MGGGGGGVPSDYLEHPDYSYSCFVVGVAVVVGL